MKVLFICKKRKLAGGGGGYAGTMSSGLLNSATFVNDMLVKNGIDSDIVEVVDNNGIDRVVTKFKPTHVIIEALWVVPSKFEILTKLHPKVQWIIRLHSEIPFLANEGIAMSWIYEYQKYKNISISVNSPRIEKDLNAILEKPVLLLPNYYPVQFGIINKHKKENDSVINIGCFGAIRPLKNHLMQAITAIQLANDLQKTLRFHINVGRQENNGDPVLKNIRDLFKNNKNHKLVEHKWMTHNNFIKVIQNMDICMQLSFSETFNIVTADAVNNNVPIVVSNEISWVFGLFKASPTDSRGILSKLKMVWGIRKSKIHFINKISLYFNSRKAEKIWIKIFS